MYEELLEKSILGQSSMEADFDFQSQVSLEEADDNILNDINFNVTRKQVNSVKIAK